MSSDPVAPRPGWLRAVGVLNVLVGLTLLSLGLVAAAFVLPYLAANGPMQLDPEQTQVVVDEMKRLALDDLGAREHEAPDAAAKAKVHAERVDFEAVPTSLAGRFDFAAVNARLPWIDRYLWLDLLTGPLLNGLMIVSGVGLIRLRAWGRRLAAATLLAKLVRLAMLAAVLGLMAVPAATFALDQFIRTEFGKAFIEHALASQGRNGLPGASTTSLTGAEVVRILRASGGVLVLVGAGLAAVYPAVMLLILTRRAARAACHPAPEFPAPGQ